MKTLCGALATLVLTALVFATPASARIGRNGAGRSQRLDHRARPADDVQRTENVLWTAPCRPERVDADRLGNRVFVSSPDAKTQKLLAIALDARTGKVLWQKETGETAGATRTITCLAVADHRRQDRLVLLRHGQIFAFDVEATPSGRADLTKSHGLNPLMSATAPARSSSMGASTSRSSATRSRTGTARADGAPSRTSSRSTRRRQDLWKQERPTDARDEGRKRTPRRSLTEGGRREVLVCGGDYLTGHDPPPARSSGDGPATTRSTSTTADHPVAGRRRRPRVRRPGRSTRRSSPCAEAGDLAEKASHGHLSASSRRGVDARLQGRLYALDDDGKS